jgi:hypothetical protein
VPQALRAPPEPQARQARRERPGPRVQLARARFRVSWARREQDRLGRVVPRRRERARAGLSPGLGTPEELEANLDLLRGPEVGTRRLAR